MSSDLPDTRTKILDATRDLLEQGGGQGVRMSDIAKRAGISRQAVYLHFPTRTELLIATTLFLDELAGIDDQLAASRSAPNGIGRLDAFIKAWGNHIPRIYGVGRALMAMQDSDPDARVAWQGRMQAVREGCEAAVRALERDGHLNPALDVTVATDTLWMLLSVRNWEQLSHDCGWSQNSYLERINRLAHHALVMADP